MAADRTFGTMQITYTRSFNRKCPWKTPMDISIKPLGDGITCVIFQEIPRTSKSEATYEPDP